MGIPISRAGGETMSDAVTCAFVRCCSGRGWTVRSGRVRFPLLAMRSDARLCCGSRVRHCAEGEIDGLVGKLPDRRDSTQDEKAVRDRLKQTAFFLFRPHE
jgi:hypothetical protein